MTNRTAQQRGMTLVEVLLAMTILAFSFLLCFAIALNKAFRTIRPIFRQRGKINAEVTGRLAESLGLGEMVVGPQELRLGPFPLGDICQRPHEFRFSGLPDVLKDDVHVFDGFVRHGQSSFKVHVHPVARRAIDHLSHD